MKEYFKAVAGHLVAVVLFVFCIAMLRLGETALAVELGVSMSAVPWAMLTFALVAGAIETIWGNRRKKRAAEIIPVLLNDAITVQKKILEKIDAEPAGAGKTRQRAMCKITLVALEEKRDRMTAGKDGRL